MEKLLTLLFKIYIGLLIFTCSCKSQQTCPPPNYPVGGSYSPKWNKENKFQGGDTINYTCEPTYTLMGNDTSRCKTNGDWTNPTPFCDRKESLKYPRAILTKGVSAIIQQINDGNKSSCYALKLNEAIVVDLDKKKEVLAVRLFLGSGTVSIEIYTGGSNKCTSILGYYLETSQWVMIPCHKNREKTNMVKIQDKGGQKEIITICEIEVYAKDEDGCENPPTKRIPNGYFEVSRSKAQLICEEGYQSAYYKRLVCEDNDWEGNKLQCNEILCDARINSTESPGSEWVFLEPVKKISAGTWRKLKCSSGYKRIGWPEEIVCYKNGTWTNTNATCVEEEEDLKLDTRTTIFAVAGIVVILLIILLLGLTIYFVRKQRNRPVVVLYKSPAEGSVISGSSGDYALPYYETIQANAPQPPSSSRPTAELLQDPYFLPLDRKDTLKRKQQPMPADIAFGTLKSSSLYGT